MSSKVAQTANEALSFLCPATCVQLHVTCCGDWSHFVISGLGFHFVAVQFRLHLGEQETRFFF